MVLSVSVGLLAYLLLWLTVLGGWWVWTVFLAVVAGLVGCLFVGVVYGSLGLGSGLDSLPGWFMHTVNVLGVCVC